MFFRNKSKPRKRDIFAVTTGDYIGEFFVYTEEQNEIYMFLSLPKMHIREVPVKVFQSSIKSKILSLVEQLPPDIYTVCIEQYKKIRSQKRPTLVDKAVVENK
jgi:hypothetical protein